MEFLPSGGIKLDAAPPAGGMGMPAQPATTGAALARIGLPTLAREADLRRAAMLTPEEAAANQAAETSPAARAQMEAAILEERDPAKRAILQSAFQQDFGTAPQGGMMRVSQPVQAPRTAPVAQRAPTWDEVVQHPSMQTLSADDMEKARNQYFLDVVAPTVRTVKDLRAARSEFDTKTAPKPFLQDLVGAAKKSWETFKTSEQATAFLAAGGDAAPLSKSIASDVAAQKDPPAYVRPLMQAVKEANDTQGFWQGLLGVGKVLYAGVTNPKATAYVTTENLANQIASLSGMVAGGVAGSAIGGPAGAIGGMALGALVGNHPEAGAKLVELAVSEAQKRKLDPRDPAAVQTVLDSPEFQAEARKQGLLKWAVVGGVDALTALVGAKMLTGPQRALQAQVTRELTARGVNVADKVAVKAALELPDVAAALRPAIERAAAASTTGQKALRAGGAFALETAGEGTGELLGEAAASGEWKPGEAALEAVASIGQSAGQTIASKALTAPGAIASVVRGGGQGAAEQATAPAAPGGVTAADVLGPAQTAEPVQEGAAAPAAEQPAAPAVTPAQGVKEMTPDVGAIFQAAKGRAPIFDTIEKAAGDLPAAAPEPAPAAPAAPAEQPFDLKGAVKSMQADPNAIFAAAKGQAPIMDTIAKAARDLPETKPPTPAQQAQAGITPPAEGTAIAASSPAPAVPQPAAAKPAPANKLAPMQDDRLKDESLLGYLKGVSDEAGRGEMGGKLIVDETNRDRTPGAGEVLGKTDWVGPEWWQIRPADARIPGDTNGSASREALRKALAGEPMRAVERRAVQFMLEEAQLRAAIDAEDQTAAGIDVLPAEEQDDTIDVADDVVSLYADDWSAMSEEQREAELDAVFGKAPAQAEGRPTVPAGESGGAQAGPPETGPAGEAAGEVDQAAPATPSPEGVAASEARPGKRARPKPREESQQEKSEREFRENYDRVSNTDDLAQVSSQDLERARSYASRKSQSEKRKGWDGGQANQNLVQALDGEADRIKRELKRRETPDLDLTGQTRDEVAAGAEKREEEARRAAEEESKAKADAARGDFTLTGSDRAADEAAARGQGDLLAEPKPGAKIEDVGEKIGGARKNTATAGGPKRANASAEDTSDPAWRKRFVVAQIIKSSRLGENGRWIISDVRSKDMLGQPRRVGETFATKEDAEAAVPLVAVALKHRVYSARGDGYEIWRNVTDRKRVKVVNQTFETREDAMRYMATHAAEILEAKTGFGEEILPRPDKVRREGAKRREGDATGQDFMDTFGFRAVEFGNWEAQDERQQVMNHAFDALMDLAEIIGVPPKALGLNGDLALAFGARGHGLRGSRAHYERDYGVINLTKMKGAGSLAHEWFHAADHYFGRQDGKAKSERAANERGDMVFRAESPEGDYVSHGFGRDSKVREDLRSSYKRVIDTMLTKAEQYVEDTKKAEEYVGKTRDDLRSQLNKIREDLAAQKDPTYWKKNNKPASAEQLAKFDELAEKLVQGEALETQSRVISPGKSRRSFGVLRMTNDVIEQLSAIYKEVRGRSGFDSTNRGGIFDAVTDAVRRYAQRVNHLESARASETKERRVPTSFSMEARTIDQGRTSDYWATPHEMAARAFQSYVEDKVAESGGRSDFLTYGTNMVVPTPWGWARPFPEGAERKAINAAFDDLFRVMETKDTDKGVALFSRETFETPRSDLGTNGLPRLANSTVVLGRTILLGNPSQSVSTARASLYDPKTKRLVGEAIFDFNRETSQIEALRRITVERQHRGKGYAEGVVRAILGYNAPDTELRIVSILDEAKSFWRRLGADFDANETEPDGGITRGRFTEAGRTAAPAAQVGTDTARADASGRRGAGPGPRTSQADQVTETPADAGVSASAARVSAEIAARMGRPAEDLGAKVVGSIADLPAGLRSYVTSQNATDTQGVYDPSTGDVYLVATNIAPGRAFAVYLHELGVHKGLRALLGDERMGTLAKQVRAWARGAGTIEEIRLAKIALARIPEGTPAAVADEELIAYFVEEAVKAGHDIPQSRPERGRLAQWLHDLWAAVRGALEKLGMAPETLTASEVVSLARGAAERVIQQDGGARQDPHILRSVRGLGDGFGPSPTGTGTANVIRVATLRLGLRHAPAVVELDGEYHVVIDGRSIGTDPSLDEARESARYADAEFWRGEFEGFSDRWPKFTEPELKRLRVLESGQNAADNDPRFSRAGNPAQQQAQRRAYREVAGSVLDRVEAVLDPLHNLPDKAAYLKSRYLALGKIWMVDELAKGIRETFANATPDDRRAAYEYLTTADATPDGIQGGRTLARAVEVKGQINYVGDQLVARGLLSEETREAHRDAYLPRLYLKHLLSEQDFRALGTGRKPSDMGYLKQRKDIPEEVRKAILGEIEDPGFLSAVAIAKPVRDMALLDWLSQIATNKDWVLPKSVVQWRGQRVSPMWLKSEAARIRRQIPVMQDDANAKRAREISEEMDQVADDAVEMLRGADLDGWKQMPNTPRFGRMRGIWVRSEIYDDMMGVNDFLPTDPGFFQSLLGYGGIGTKATQLWKMSKVALNPPAQVRNFVSNAVLLQLSGVPLARVPQRVIQAFREIANDGPHWKVAKKYGVTESTFSTQELFRFKRELLDLAHNEGKLSPLGQLQRIAAIVGDFASDLYQKAEAVFKTAKIIDAMEREGKSESEAALEAQKWLFDYSLVHREVRYLRNAPIGMPFLTFQAKVLPRLIEVATLHPMRLLPWVALSFGLPVAVAAMLGVSGDDLEKLRKALPEWLQKRGHAYILPYQDADGRWQAIDLGYFFPWTMFTQLAGDIGRGEPMEALGTVGLFSGPVVDVLVAMKTNKDPFTKREIVKEGDPPAAQLVSVLNYFYDMMAPPWLSSKGLVSLNPLNAPLSLFSTSVDQYLGKAYQAATGKTNKYGDPTTTGMQATVYPFGVNLYSLEAEHTRAANLLRMKFEMDQVRRELNKRMQDRGLSAERRQEIIDEYRAEMERRVKKIQEYARESEVPQKLRVRTGTGG